MSLSMGSSSLLRVARFRALRVARFRALRVVGAN
jgi:hypothetical protein